MSLYTYLTTNVLDTLAETLSIGNHYVGVGSVVGAAPRPGLGLCIAV